MGLQSALSTSLTGLSAAETVIDVIGNNLANSQTVGFKESDVVFATQFLQTLSLGSGPTDSRGGTNPRQVGLGTQVAQIAPKFTQGTIEVSANASDLAIQGDGFFIVQSPNEGAELYTRTGAFTTNSQNELVTPTGHRLLGYGVDEDFVVQKTTLEPLSIPLGAESVAKATENVYFEGTLSPTGDVASQAAILQTGILGDASQTAPDTTNGTAADTSDDTQASPTSATPPAGTTFTPAAAAGGLTPSSTYRYKLVYAEQEVPVVPVPGGETIDRGESLAREYTVTLGAGENEIDLTNLPATDGTYGYLRIYRQEADAAADDPFYFVDQLDVDPAAPANYTDVTSDVDLATQPELVETTLTGTYEYYVVFADAPGGPPNGTESRPSTKIGPVTVSNGRVLLENLPTDQAAAGDWSALRIYRNVQSDSQEFHYVAEITDLTQTTFTDTFTDSGTATDPIGIEDNELIDLDGPRANEGTLLADVLVRNGSTYETPFGDGGTLTFAASKGGRKLTPKTLEIDPASTTVGQFLRFMEDAAGIQVSAPGSTHPIPFSDVEGSTSTEEAGARVTTNGQIRFVSNNGEDNALNIKLDSLQLKTDAGTQNINIPFGSVQDAIGESAVTDFIVYDSLGTEIPVRVTAVLESKTSISTTYRWFADSGDNQPTDGVDIAIGTGLITFDGEGNVIDITNNTVNIDRNSSAATSPLSFDLHLDKLSGLEVPESSLAASVQDGTPAGTLSDYIIGEDGTVRGVFTNGSTRDLGQIVLARFANANGLEQVGQNLFASGVNSGLPIKDAPGLQGIGTLVAGANELSNTDVGQNLVELILASSQYRGNTRVINTAQQLLDELLNLRR